MKWDNNCYLVLLLGVLCMEIFFSIPLLLDSLINANAVWVVMVVGASHVFLYMYAKSGVVTKGNPAIHAFGVLAMATSFIPAIGFVLHIPVAVKGWKHLYRQYKGTAITERESGKEKQKRKTFRQWLGERLLQDDEEKERR